MHPLPDGSRRAANGGYARLILWAGPPSPRCRGEAVEHAKQLSPVGPCADRFLAEDVAARAPGRPELIALGIKRLTAGRDAGATEEVFFGVEFWTYLTANVTH